MITNREFSAESADAGARVEHAIVARIPSTCRSLALSAIEQGAVTVNGSPARKGGKLLEGDSVRIVQLMETSDRRAMPDPALPLDVVHEDASFLVVNKPGGMPVHPIRPGETGTLINALLARHPGLAGVGPDPMFPAAVHRVDTDTSGLVLVARNDKAYGALRGLFAARKVVKAYLALVTGEVSDSMTVENDLIHSPRPSHRMRVLERAGNVRGAMHAVTECSPKRHFAGWTLLDVIIRTGVTHQIRCQLAWAGHPLAGDNIYGVESPAYRGRLFLHATRLEFSHPETGEPVAFEAGLPADLAEAMKGLRPR